MMIMKYEENPQAIDAKSALYHLNLKHRHMMKNPAIMANSRFAGDGSPSVYIPYPANRPFPPGVGWRDLEIRHSSEECGVQRVVSPVASWKAFPLLTVGYALLYVMLLEHIPFDVVRTEKRKKSR